MRFWLIALVAACGVGDRDIEDQITIQQGVYGLVTSADDEPAVVQIVVYAPGENGTHARASSNDTGVYEIDLAAGDYTLCIESCTSITVPEHGKIRYDWTNGPGGGRWSN